MKRPRNQFSTGKWLIVYACDDECAKMVPKYGIMTERERAEFTNKVVEEVKEFINLRYRRPGITIL